MTSRRTLRIACLHGYCQNAAIFRQKSGGLRKSLQRNASVVRLASNSQCAEEGSDSDTFALSELVYIDAPFAYDAFVNPYKPSTDENKARAVLAPPNPTAEQTGTSLDRTQRLWWKTDPNRNYVGWAESLQYLRRQFQQNRFDGILGFSQGAVVASLVCSLRDKPDSIPEFASLKFAILISGFPSRAEIHKPLYETPIRLPSVHVWGTQDVVVPPYGSQALMETFDPSNRQSVVHDKGHLVPSDAVSRAKISDFILRMSDENFDDSAEGARAAL